MARCRRRTSARKVGRGLLASSHAGTRLPIAVTSRRIRGRSAGPDTGRSPSVRSRLGRDAGMVSPSFRSKELKNSGYPWVPTVKALYELPPVALPTSGKRVEAFASSQPAGSPVFCPIMAPEHRAVKAVFQRDGLDKRKAAAYTVPRKGVLGRGLRGGCIPSTSPDLGNANVGMRRKSDIFPRPAHLPQTCG